MKNRAHEPSVGGLLSLLVRTDLPVLGAVCEQYSASLMGIIPAVGARLRTDPLCAHVAAVPNPFLDSLLASQAAESGCGWCCACASTVLGSFFAASSSAGVAVGLGLLPLGRQRGGCVLCWDGHLWVLYVTQPRNWRGPTWCLGALL